MGAFRRSWLLFQRSLRATLTDNMRDFPHHQKGLATYGLPSSGR